MRFFKAAGTWKRFQNLRLREKMTVTFLVFGFLPMLLTSLIIQGSVMESLKREAEQSSLRGIEQIAERVDEHLSMYNTVADVVVHDDQLISLLNRNYQSLNEAIDLYHYMWKLRSSVLRSNYDIDSVVLYVEQPALASAPPYLIRVDAFREFADYESLLKAQYSPYLTDMRALTGGQAGSGAESGGYTATLNRVITRPNSLSQPIGVVSIIVDSGALQSLIWGNVSHSMTMIVDGQDKIVSAVQNGGEAGTALSGKLVYDYIPEQVWLGGRDAYYQDAGRGEMRLILRELKWGWKVVSVLSMGELQADARAAQRRGIWMICACAVLAVILVSLVSAKTARRAKLLLDKFSVSQGAKLLPGEPVGGADEIGELDMRFMAMASQLNQTIHELYAVELQKKESQLTTLQARINPHFLYNTLSNIAWMTQTSPPEDVRKAIEMLAVYYRTCLSGGRDMVTLHEELDSVSAYLSIQKMRMGRRLQTTIWTDPMLDDVLIPRLTLQPIVENSIEHGITHEQPEVSIRITSAVEGEQALIYVADDGPGFRPDMLKQLREGSYAPSNGGYGIRNVQMRLRLSFGAQYGLDFENLEGKGARTIIRIPLRESWSDEQREEQT